MSSFIKTCIFKFKGVPKCNNLSPKFLDGISKNYQISCNFASTKSKQVDDGKSRVVISDDGQTLICWHPEQPFPYEHSKPLPEFSQKFAEEDSVLKLQNRIESLSRTRKGGPTDIELSKMTYTYKGQWFRLARRFKRPKFFSGEDRPGI